MPGDWRETQDSAKSFDCSLAAFSVLGFFKNIQQLTLRISRYRALEVPAKGFLRGTLESEKEEERNGKETKGAGFSDTCTLTIWLQEISMAYLHGLKVRFPPCCVKEFNNDTSLKTTGSSLKPHQTARTTRGAGPSLLREELHHRPIHLMTNPTIMGIHSNHMGGRKLWLMIRRVTHFRMASHWFQV